jgi:hypothetical protein
MQRLLAAHRESVPLTRLVAPEFPRLLNLARYAPPAEALPHLAPAPVAAGPTPARGGGGGGASGGAGAAGGGDADEAGELGGAPIEGDVAIGRGRAGTGDGPTVAWSWTDVDSDVSQSAAVAAVASVVGSGLCRNVRLSRDGRSVVPLTKGERVRAKLEFYFGDANYWADGYLQKLVADAPGDGGWVSVTEICRWKAMVVSAHGTRASAHSEALRTTTPPPPSAHAQRYSVSPRELVAAVADSPVVETAADGLWVRRRVVPLGGRSAIVRLGSAPIPALVFPSGAWERVAAVLDRVLSWWWLMHDPAGADLLLESRDGSGASFIVPVSSLADLLVAIAHRPHVPPAMVTPLQLAERTLRLAAAHPVSEATLVAATAAGVRLSLRGGVVGVVRPAAPIPTRAIVLSRRLRGCRTGALSGWGNGDSSLSVMTFNLLAEALATPDAYQPVDPQALA